MSVLKMFFNSLTSPLDRVRLPLTPHDQSSYTLLSPTEPDNDGEAQSFPRQVWRSNKRHGKWKAILFVISTIAVLFAAVFTIRRVLRPPGPPSVEPLDMLDPISHARWTIDSLYERQSKTLAQASARYTLKTNRNPPKNYEKWFRFAKSKSCLIDDYDQIYRDFEPFYQLADKDPEFFKKMVDSATEKVKQVGNGMKTGQFKGGSFRETDNQGTLYNGDWQRTMDRFANLLPDMNIILNGRDEPRILFNHRDEDVIGRALDVSDPTPFEHQPSPTSMVFKDQKMCIIPNRPSGFTSPANDASAFLIDSSSTQYTTDFYPMLSMTRISPCFSDILVPSEFYYSDSSWAPKYSHANDIAWDDKTPKLYWRGATSGGIIHGDNYRKFPRFHMIDIGRNHSDIIDVALTVFQGSLCSDDCNGEAIKKEYGITGEGAPREDAYQYKYLADVDGNSFSGRYFGLLRSGSLVFKSTVFNEYFNDWLRPFVHFIPVLPDMSDLVAKVEWAIANDAEAHRIQEAGRQFAERVLTDAQNDCYFIAVLLEWAQLHDYASRERQVSRWRRWFGRDGI
ncbi:glycosyl transferase family 90-domain-containing protein [Mycena floridula]|nr:glycosyl transferase family 90-domain-containing protein [Mycena floridula]